ncbi:MAG: DUF4362 domain-containing protein [Oscillospiraceae bacterium]|nr:DUF4362 domain-containing protein [Oscillospiraceae bacterium]
MMKRRMLLPLLFLCALLLGACAAQSAAPAASVPPAEALSEMDLFYQNPLTAPYGDIRRLDADYSAEQAQADRCFVIGAMVHSDDLFTAFMTDYENGEDAFIRVVQTTTEGDPILTDVLYDSAADEVLLVRDATRDAFAAEEDRVITLEHYDGVTEYGSGHLYWIAYRGALEDLDPMSEDLFVIAAIN